MFSAKIIIMAFLVDVSKYFVIFVNHPNSNAMESIFGKRLTAARKMTGLSLQGLADKLGNAVTKQALSKYEQGKMKPNSELVIQLAGALNVTADYFFISPTVTIELTEMDFRKHSSKISKSNEASIQEKVKEKLQRYFELESLLNLEEEVSDFKYPHIISNAEDAELAAIMLRDIWDLGYDPIPDVVELLEDKGYKVIEIEVDKGFGGMKAKAAGKKVIVLNKESNDDIVRKRMTALHEFAHHSLVFPDGILKNDEEKLCFAFASAVLYPAQMARKELQANRFHFMVNELVILKERWGISMPAIFNRALKLGIINHATYKNFNISYRSGKIHLNEPGRFRSQEKPTRFERLIFFALGQDLISVNDAAYFTGISVWKFRESMMQLI
jgi:transcriptional regulator with XRE-family HTH domain